MAAELEVNIASMLGLNNRRPDFRLRTQNGIFQAAVRNADVTDSFSIKGRDGYVRAVSGTDVHSFWVDHTDDMAYYVDGATLYRAKVSGVGGLRTTSLMAGMLHGRRLSYARVGDEVMFTDGSRNFAMTMDGIVRPLGVSPLAAAPRVSGVAGGALARGQYQVCLAYMNDGREISPTTPALAVDVPDSGAISIDGLPAVWPADVETMVVYVSHGNGTEMTLQRELVDPATTLVIPVVAIGGMQPITFNRSLMPAGQIMRWYAGRLYVVDQNFLWFSDVYYPSVCTPHNGYVQFNEPITVFEPCDGGAWLVADGAYWLAGDITTAEAKRVSPCRGVLGSGGYDLAAEQAFWLSDHGFVIGKPDGTLVLPQIENVAVDLKAQRGASFVREINGQRHVLTALHGGTGAVTAASSYITAEVVRKGITS